MLFQLVNEMNPGDLAVIMNANCTRFKESQLRFSPVEAKGSALDLAISCCRLLPMSKKAEAYKKELEIKDHLVEKIAEIRGQDFECVTLLQHVENKTE